MLASFAFWDIFRTRFFILLVLAWIFMFGASIGSFLNVVVYRMPLGKSLHRRGSYCPYCHQPIRLRDNIPVFGWINLRGRCRQCRLPISVGYPIVEALTGIMFVLFYLFETATGGAQLPFTKPHTYHDGALGILQGTQSELLGIYAFHVLLVCVLWAAFLIERDGHLVPIRLIAVPLIVAVVAATVWPHLLPVDWFVYFDLGDALSPLLRRFSSIIGAACGLVLGFVLGRLVERRNRANPRWHSHVLKLVLIFAFVGATFGWQSVLAISLPFVMLLMLAREFHLAVPASRPCDCFGILLLLAIALWLSWRWVFTDFERLIVGLPYLASGILAVILTACFRFEQRVFPLPALKRTDEQQITETVVDAHPDDRINL